MTQIIPKETSKIQIPKHSNANIRKEFRYDNENHNDTTFFL
jgi:hypothetical protein